jgi:branched-chain amino acid transport system substrate-binding protein
VSTTVRSPAARACAVLVGLVAVVAACDGGDAGPAPTTTVVASTTTVPERVGDGQLKLGAFLPLTGAGAPFGPPMIDAIEESVSTINASGGVLGRNVELVSVDEGAGTIDELLTHGVDAIIGPASSALAMSSLRPAVDANTGVVTCSPMATALALDDYPDNGFFFRTAPSDSLQMAAVARVAERTGAQSVAIGYLDDPYGRGLEEALQEAMASRPIPIVTSVGFSADQDDLSSIAEELLAEGPGVVVVLGDTDDGSRLLAALDGATTDPPQVVINDSIRQARAIIQNLSPVFRNRLTGVAPQSGPAEVTEPTGFFVPHAVDCVNLIALAALDAESDNPVRIRANMAAVSTGGRGCTTFETCAALVEQNLGIDYNGVSGRVDLSNASGDPIRAWFETFGFDSSGNEVPQEPIELGA